MTQEMKEYIKAQPPIFLKEANRGTYVCPKCNSGNGEHHTGIQQNPKKPGQWHCWSCGFTGDIVDLVKAAYGIYSFKDAFDKAAELYGVTNDSEEWIASHEQNPEDDLPGNTGFYQMPQERKIYQPVAPREKIDYTKYFMECRRRNRQMDYKYLMDRGISPAIQDLYDVGYDPAWKSPAAIKNRIERGGSADDIPASPRCIIPRGRHSYLARRTDGQDAMKKMAEGQTEILNINKLSTAEIIFVTEGEIDAMSITEASQFIYSHAPQGEIALCSCAMINKFLTEIDERIAAGTLTAKYICTAFDTDKAGREATERLRIALQNRGIHVEELIIYDPEAKDVNEWLQRDFCGLEDMIEAHIRAYEQGKNPDVVYKEMFMQNQPVEEKAEEEEKEIEEPALYEEFF